jgi:putative SOS response-associated peptidase YedK
MCGRYTYTTRRSDEIHAKLADTLGVRTPPSHNGFERFNIAPTQEVLAVVDDRDGRRIEWLRWGLVPHWAKELNTRLSMINARAETLHEKPAYRGLVRQAEHRCLILADGYYEWQRPEDPKQPRRPVHFSLDGNQPFCFAGLWTRWRPPGGGVVSSCAIVTCPANAFTRPIHDRMPVILADPEGWECWLDPAADGEAARELLVPLPSERTVARLANPVLNSPLHEGPDCLAVLGREAGAPSPRAFERPARLLDPGRHRSGGRSRPAVQLGLFHGVPSRG